MRPAAVERFMVAQIWNGDLAGLQKKERGRCGLTALGTHLDLSSWWPKQVIVHGRLIDEEKLTVWLRLHGEAWVEIDGGKVKQRHDSSDERRCRCDWEYG